MIVDAIPFSHVHKDKSHLAYKTISSFIAFLEKKLGGNFIYDSRELPFHRADLREPFALATTLKRAGIIRSIEFERLKPDEPPFKYWRAYHAAPDLPWTAGGSVTSDADALYPALSEAIERHIWSRYDDYFEKPIRATVPEMERGRNPFLPPEIFAGFSDDQKGAYASDMSSSDMPYIWIKGVSMISGGKVYLPAQIISGKPLNTQEPLIRPRVTTGLATWKDLNGARLRGVLEVIERDAYMIMWANKLTLPRINLKELRTKSESLSTLLERCERYRLRVHAVKLLTDAPAHVVSVVIEDMSEHHAPKYTIGNKAGKDIISCITGAALEALRIRLMSRNFWSSEAASKWDHDTPVSKLGHFDRLLYWDTKERAQGLAFLINGPEEPAPTASWENASDKDHLDQIINWCRGKEYECVSVSLGRSKQNPTPLSVEMVVIPQMQPMHLYESSPSLSGKRMKEIPRIFGFIPREIPFSGPHPFC